MPASLRSLPTLTQQADRLIALGVHEISGMAASELRAMARDHTAEESLLVVHPDLAPASQLASLLERNGQHGFVVADMADVDEFSPIESVTLPATSVYVTGQPDRGDHMANWSPKEALPALTADDRTPLTLTEGIHWVLQQPELLERNRCFMTIGSRLIKTNGTLDARTPALWISNGTGRDGKHNRDAPKIGWCWAGNRHTWLGFASASSRTSSAAAPRR